MSDPMVQRTLVGKGLRTARIFKQMSQSAAATELDWSASKLTRIERGDTPASKTDLEAALRLYGVWGTPMGDELVARGIEARKKPWWHAYLAPTAGTPEGRLGKLLSFESEARVINGYETSIVPELLQTQDYSREVLRCLAPKSNETDGLGSLRARRRQEVFRNDRPPKVHFVLDEAVVLRWVGVPAKPSIMIDQLRYMKAQVIEHGIDLRVIPLDRGMHAGLKGPITVYRFDASSCLEDVAFVGEAVFIRDADTAEYLQTFQALHDLALSPEESMLLIDRVIASMSTEEALAGHRGCSKDPFHRSGRTL
ncbi:helix-turn-helix domain-containing protein [Embleya sp. MST-111070]|uniref:helix-turn-helix domain-containing protein n=1 Tax=Embleya sp. MST-111070 TaxID=3398231 RepID=UPI003F7316B9